MSCTHTRWRIEKWTIHALDRATRQYQKRLSSITAVKGGHIEYFNTVFNMTTLTAMIKAN